MTVPDLRAEIRVAVKAVREASARVLDIYSTDFAVEFKEAREPVTLADRESNTLLCDRISKAFPSDGIVAEESAAQDPAAVNEQTTKSRVWFIDPLDGTKEFIARNGEFAIMVGLALAGRAALGVIAVPVLGQIWIGQVGDRAWRTGLGDEVTECRVSSVATLSDATLLVSRSHRSDRLLDAARRLPGTAQIVCGSVGVKAARIASSQADLFIYLHQPHGARLWDACGPEAVVIAAGGRCTDARGRSIDYARNSLELTDGLVVSNGLVHEAVLDVIRGHAARAERDEKSVR